MRSLNVPAGIECSSGKFVMQKQVYDSVVSVLTYVPKADVPFRFIPGDASIQLTLPLTKGQKVAETKEELEKLAKSIMFCHVEDGYELRIDASDPLRLRMCCTTHTRGSRTVRLEPKRVKGTIRKTSCPVAISFRFDEKCLVWYISSIPSTIHTHSSTRIRQPLRNIRETILPTILHQRRAHHVSITSLLSQQAEAGFQLTRQELYNILASAGPTNELTDPDETPKTQTGRLIHYLDEDEDVAYIAMYSVLDQSTGTVMGSVVQLKLPVLTGK